MWQFTERQFGFFGALVATALVLLISAFWGALSVSAPIMAFAPSLSREEFDQQYGWVRKASVVISLLCIFFLGWLAAVQLIAPIDAVIAGVGIIIFFTSSYFMLKFWHDVKDRSPRVFDDVSKE